MMALDFRKETEMFRSFFAAEYLYYGFIGKDKVNFAAER